MFVAVGSRRTSTTTSRRDAVARDILEFTPDGKDERVYASGIRNPVGSRSIRERASCGHR